MRKLVVLFLILTIACGSFAKQANQKPMVKYLYLLVHGHNSHFAPTWTSLKNSNKKSFIDYLVGTFKLDGMVTGYSYFSPYGSAIDNVNQLANPFWRGWQTQPHHPFSWYEDEWNKMNSKNSKYRNYLDAPMSDGRKRHEWISEYFVTYKKLYFYKAENVPVLDEIEAQVEFFDTYERLDNSKPELPNIILPSGIRYRVKDGKVQPNCWLMQLMEDRRNFIARDNNAVSYKNNPERELAKVPVTDPRVQSNIIIMAHSFGNLSTRLFLSGYEGADSRNDEKGSLFEYWTKEYPKKLNFEKYISFDGTHWGTDGIILKEMSRVGWESNGADFGPESILKMLGVTLKNQAVKAYSLVTLPWTMVEILFELSQ